MSPSVAPASETARSTTGTMLVRCARDASSGTTPPYTRWTSWERMTSDFCDTSSPEPSSTAAEVSSHEVSIPSIVVMSLLTGRLGQEPFYQSSMVRGVPVRGGQKLLPDDAVPPDDESFRIAEDVVLLDDLLFRIVENLECEFVLFHERANGRGVAGVIDAHCENLESLRREVAVERLDARHLDAAGKAPRRPHVDHHDLTAVIR